jgi:hypothetical protein
VSSRSWSRHSADLPDADQLRQALLAPGPASLTARVGAYEKQMRGYANQALARSTRNARNAASPARLPRIAFRSALRFAEAVPAAKRRMFRTAPDVRAIATVTPTQYAVRHVVQAPHTSPESRRRPTGRY